MLNELEHIKFNRHDKCCSSLNSENIGKFIEKKKCIKKLQSNHHDQKSVFIHQGIKIHFIHNFVLSI